MAQLGAQPGAETRLSIVRSRAIFKSPFIALPGLFKASADLIMPFRFKLHEPIDEGLRRIVSEQIARACQELDCAGQVVPSAIHNTRKAIKRLRALLRLARPALGEKAFSAHNASLQSIAASLSSTRDDDIVSETIDKLETQFGEDGIKILAPLRHSLAEKSGVKPRIGGEQAHEVAQRLTIENEDFAALNVRADLSTLKQGLQKSYAKAVKAYAAAYENPSDESFHDLRKTVQWHWRQMALLSRAWPDYFKVRVDAARELSQILGDEHDLSLLRASVAARDDLTLDQHGPIIRLARARQEELRHEALSRAELLLFEPPKPFAKRMAGLWAAGRDGRATHGRDEQKPGGKTTVGLTLRTG